MAKLQSVRGTHDINGDAATRHRHVVATARDCARCYGFGDIDVPLFEFTPQAEARAAAGTTGK